MRRKTIRTCAAVLVLASALSSCSSGQGVKQTNIGETISVQSPMTISDNRIDADGDPKYLRLKLVRGKYYEDWYPGPVSGTVWEGDFAFELADGFGNAIARTELNRFYREPLVFTSHFRLEFDDYNADGDPDFTIGQYASSNGWEYRLFTLRDSGSVEELPIRNHPSLFISMHSDYSLKLEKVDPKSFKTVHYENSRQVWIERVFRWDGEAFVQTENREVEL